jgi:hypothetical protein
MIRSIVAIISLFTAGMGIVGLVSPAGLIAFVSIWKAKIGLWAAVIVRLIFGVTLWYAAPVSRTPAPLRILAMISVIAAFTLPLLGVSRYRSLVSWWSRQSPLFIRVWSTVAAGLGIFILWSILS